MIHLCVNEFAKEKTKKEQQNLLITTDIPFIRLEKHTCYGFH